MYMHQETSYKVSVSYLKESTGLPYIFVRPMDDTKQTLFKLKCCSLSLQLVLTDDGNIFWMIDFLQSQLKCMAE